MRGFYPRKSCSRGMGSVHLVLCGHQQVPCRASGGTITIITNAVAFALITLELYPANFNNSLSPQVAWLSKLRALTCNISPELFKKKTDTNESEGLGVTPLPFSNASWLGLRWIWRVGIQNGNPAASLFRAKADKTSQLKCIKQCSQQE